MIKQYFLVIVSILAIAACSNEKNNKPEGLIDEAKFIKILADIHTTEAEIFISYPNQDTAYTMFKAAEYELLKANHVTKADYDSTTVYYSTHPKQFDQIYASVVDTLSIREIKGSK